MMKRRLVLVMTALVAAGLLGGAAYAGQGGEPHKGVLGLGNRGAAVAERLGLTEKQKADIKELIAAAKVEFRKAEGVKEKVGVLRDALRKIKAVLDEDQLDKIKKFRENHPGLRDRIRERIRERLHKGHAGEGAAKTE